MGHVDSDLFTSDDNFEKDSEVAISMHDIISKHDHIIQQHINKVLQRLIRQLIIIVQRFKLPIILILVDSLHSRPYQPSNKYSLVCVMLIMVQKELVYNLLVRE